jgi:carbon-monoxide dehydrogenase large subunit
MENFSIGQGVSRVEDPRLLKGMGRFLNDVELPHQAYGFVVRSPHAHARIRSVGVDTAKAAPGVLAVLTGAQLRADGIGPLLCEATGLSRGDEAMFYIPRTALASDRVRHVGDPIAFVVAENLGQARDAAELVEVDYDMLPSVTSAVEAIKEGAPLVWDDCPENVCFR